MDRCALFVDAGYVLADGAMAVHGTRRRESVSWNYEGLVKFLASLATERSGLPLLRCYWYEGTADGRRTADHDALADMPGVKLRLARTRPGREGVESEIHRDLAALAANKAVTDAMVISAEEELAQVISDVQDLGMRVTLLHIAADGSWTISRALRQECDDIAEISPAHLRPYVELISGAEPARADEQEGGALIQLHPQANGHVPGGRAPSYAPLPGAPGSGPAANGAAANGAAGNGAAANGAAANGQQVPPAIYTAPVVSEYQRSAPQPPSQAQEERAALYELAPYDRAPRYDETPADDVQAAPPGPAAQPVQASEHPPAKLDLLAGLAEMPVTRQEAPEARQEVAQASPEATAGQEQSVRQDLPARQEMSARSTFTARPELYSAPVAIPAPLPVSQDDRRAELSPVRARLTDMSGYNPGAMREPVPGDQDGLQPAPVGGTDSGQIRRLPARGANASSGYPALGPSVAAQPPAGQPLNGQQSGLQQSGPQPVAGPVPLEAPGQPVSSMMPPAPTYTPVPNGAYSGPQPAMEGQPAGPVGPVGQPAGQIGPVGQSPVGPPPYGQPSFGPPSPVQPSLGQPSLSPPSPGQPSSVQPSSGQQSPGQVAPFPVGSVATPALSGSMPGAPLSVVGQPNAGNPPNNLGGPIMPSGQVPPVGAGSPANPGGTTGQNVPPFPQASAQPALSLADAVQAAHEEGQEFGSSVARDAPALWLEAVLARKPRMPSDLEARLLQGSSLPIDFLLHDEVRHALRRGFWDALERARR